MVIIKKLNQVVPSIASALLDVVLLLEQIDTPDMQLLMWQMPLSIPVNRITRSSFLLAGKASNAHTLSYFKGIINFPVLCHNLVYRDLFFFLMFNYC